jgi:hypothetical protein
MDVSTLRPLIRQAKNCGKGSCCEDLRCCVDHRRAWYRAILWRDFLYLLVNLARAGSQTLKKSW